MLVILNVKVDKIKEFSSQIHTNTRKLSDHQIGNSIV